MIKYSFSDRDFLNADVNDDDLGLAVYKVRTLRHRWLSRSKKTTTISAGSNDFALATINWEQHILQIASEAVSLSKIQSYQPSKRGIICRHFQWDSKHYEFGFDADENKWKATASDQLHESATFHPPRSAASLGSASSNVAHGVISDENDKLFILMLFMISEVQSRNRESSDRVLRTTNAF
ncbi:hypothetical protein E3P99_03312 [Wallemia hederae]|uniref:DUF6593 domain-containing protein n=1 Tax=Wallemia hederae TaxID=1540922 RepID=A0A4T0FKI0_9BASI|nr:hypothetical protein E3P99_03312 [Wallemia hederae]